MGRKSRLKREHRMAQQPSWTPFQRSDAPRPAESELFVNSRYTVIVRKAKVIGNWPEMVWLSIRRNDRGNITSWRDMQRIKNELVGAEHEGMEMFPAESRLVDASNQYHLYVFSSPDTRFPFGFADRLVVKGGIPIEGAAQSPFEAGTEPPDAKTPEEMSQMVTAHLAAGGKV